MSAFIVSDKLLNVVLTFATMKKASYYWKPNNMRVDISVRNASEIGQKLLDENFRSVNYRYRENDTAERFTYKRVDSSNYSVVDVLKAINCLDYQSCETDDWSDSEAWAILDGIKDAMIRNLPGYEASRGWSL